MSSPRIPKIKHYGRLALRGPPQNPSRTPGAGQQRTTGPCGQQQSLSSLWSRPQTGSMWKDFMCAFMECIKQFMIDKLIYFNLIFVYHNIYIYMYWYILNWYVYIYIYLYIYIYFFLNLCVYIYSCEKTDDKTWQNNDLPVLDLVAKCVA